MRHLIKNGMIYDGSGEEGYISDILINEDKIVAIDKNIDIEVEKIIDATGMIVTPGFIDSHRHCDLAALYDPEFGTIELSQGLTSVVGSNCGLGIVPNTDAHRQEIYDYVEPCLGLAPEGLGLNSHKEYYEALQNRNMPLHVGSYIGTGTVKAAVKGYGKSPFTKKEMAEAKAYIHEGLEAGALGLSMGIMYQPECYSTEEEIIELLGAATPFNRPLSCHIRGEGDNLVPSIQEMIRICDEVGLPLNISHLKATGIKNWGKNIYEAIKLIEEARDKGQDVTADFYPYNGGSTTLLSLLPPTVMSDSIYDTLGQLDGPIGREKLQKEIYKEHIGWDNMVTSIGWERILISSVTKPGNQDIVGLNFKEASELRGYEEPSYFMTDLLVDEAGKVGIILMSMSQEDIDTVAKLPYTMLISDSLYGVSDSPHPRLYGSFPKFIREYVMERKIVSMETAIRKMTAMPAQLLRLDKRGMLKEGYYGDINIFMAEKLKDHALYSNSKQLSTGLSYVMVDGKLALIDDKRQNGYCASLLLNK